jgi:hypothetical protein
MVPLLILIVIAASQIVDQGELLTYAGDDIWMWLNPGAIPSLLIRRELWPTSVNHRAEWMGLGIACDPCCTLQSPWPVNRAGTTRCPSSSCTALPFRRRHFVPFRDISVLLTSSFLGLGLLLMTLYLGAVANPRSSADGSIVSLRPQIGPFLWTVLGVLI